MFGSSLSQRSGVVVIVACLLLCLLPGRWLIAAHRADIAASAPNGRTAVTWSDFAPTNWVTTLPVTVQVTAHAAGGFVADTAAYAVSSDGGANWSDWTTTNLNVTGEGTTRSLVVSGLTWPDAATHNLIRFRIEEEGGAVETSPDYVVRIDTVAPTSTITNPPDAAVLRHPPAIAGTAADATAGVASVNVSIRSLATGQYWNGAAWTAGEHWLPATGTDAWSYNGVQPAWADALTYQIRSRATDQAGHTETPGAGVAFTYDITGPFVLLHAPNGGEIWAGGRAYTITWTASDAIGLAANPITLSVSYNGGASWQVIAAAVPNSGSYVWTPPAIDTNLALVEVAAVDRAGNRGSDRSDAFFNIDSSPPAAPINLQANPAGWTNIAAFTVSWTNPADLGPIAGAWYKLDTPPTHPADGIFVASATSIANISPATDGIHPIYVWLQDALGRADHTQRATVNLHLDRVPPSPPAGLVGQPARTWTNVNRFAEQWTNPPDLSGIVGAYYRLNTPGQTPTDGILYTLPISGTAQGRIEGIEVPADGKHDLYIWLVDAAGNADHRNRNVDPQVFWFDGTAPISDITLTPAPGPGGWYSGTVTAQFSASDGPNGSGIDAIFNQLDGTGWSTLPTLLIMGEGPHRVEYYARDVAGNIETTHTITVSLDLTPPAVTLTPNRPPTASGWYTAPITLTLQVNDGLSGAAAGYYRLNAGPWQKLTGATGQITLTTDGDYNIEYYGEDLAGNRTPVRSLRVRLDVTPPATAYLIEGRQGQGGWYISPLTVRLIPTDAGSGVAATYYRIADGPWQSGLQFNLNTDGIYTVAFYSVDLAGNIEFSFPVQIRLDTAAPAAPTAVSVSPSTWSRANRFTIQWANPTDLSGIAGIYYRLNSEPTGPEDGIFMPLTNRLDDFAVPAEGIHNLYLWLRDIAGNADHRNRTLSPPLRYDATPPVSTLRVQGIEGDSGWYRSALTLTLDATDLHSGIGALRYRLNGGAWTPFAGPLILTTADKHVLEYYGEDIAGNAEAVRQVTLRIDGDAPPSPLHVRAEPIGWQPFNAFRLLWREPLDQSGIAGVYVRFNSPPAGPTDGTFYPVREMLEGVQVPGEGKHDVYLWLRDGAGNSDGTTAVALPAALWYDGDPPVTTVTVTGQAGGRGWYIGPVSFAVTATDRASGVAQIRWQTGSEAWQPITDGSFTITADGRHMVRIASQDVAGNEEPPQLYEIAIDQQPPTAWMEALPRYQGSPRFVVAWSGADAAGGSGLESFEVQVRDGLSGPWQTWLAETTLTRAPFDGQRGHSYAFRVLARDVAGNRQLDYAVSNITTVEVIRNGSFDTGNLAEWSTAGLLRKAVVPVEGPAGVTVLAARLGSPDYGPSLTDPGSVPVGAAIISQTLTVPALNQVARPTLTFWYRVFTYDVLYSQRLERIVDTLDVTLHDAAGQLIALLLRDGNPTNTYGELYDTGWRWAVIDLTPYAGQTVQLVFANHNREDNLFNTWSFVDAVQLADWPYYLRTYLPWVNGSAGAPQVVSASAPLPRAAPDARR